MNSNRLPWLAFCLTVSFVSACSSSSGSDTPSIENIDEVTDQTVDEINDISDEIVGDIDDTSEDAGLTDSEGGELTLGLSTTSLATSGCQNVVIVNGYAYAACGDGIEIVELETFQRNFITQPADDITADAELAVLFTQSGTTLQQFTLADPMEPSVITTVATNFSIFSGVSAANGLLAVSAGSTNSNTQIYTYDASSLRLAISGIALVDDRTGNPDVQVAATPGGALAFYSEDLGLVANWGIQIIEFDTNATILELPDVVVLTPGQFTGSFGIPFGPANFPVESEFLDERLYIAHFAANGIQVIDRADSDELSLIPLGYEPTNIATDGSDLFVVGVTLTTVDTINPTTETVVETINLPLQQPVGIAASTTHLAVADRVAGLIVTTR